MIDRNNYYDEGYFKGEGSNYIVNYTNMKHRFLWHRRIKVLKSFVNSGRLLDIGCAFGYFLKFMENDFETYGMDISAYAVEKATSIHPDLIGRIKQSDIQDGIPFEGEFDIITAFDVLEHIDNVYNVLGIIYERLRKGGYLYIELPIKKTFLHRDKSHYNSPFASWMHRVVENNFDLIWMKKYFSIGLRLFSIPANDNTANYFSLIARK